MKTALIVAGIASALLFGAATVQAGSGEAGTAGGSSKASYDKQSGGGDGGSRFTPREQRNYPLKAVPREPVPGGLYKDKNSSSGPQGSAKTDVGKHHTN